MCKEINPWNFVVNALYAARDKTPLSLNSQNTYYFWKYTLIAFKKLRKELRNVCLYLDRHSLENVLWNDNLYIKIEDDTLRIDNKVDIDIVNEYLDPSVRKKLSKIFLDAYEELEYASKK